jgi:DNA end-binding protein Ku
MARAIWKGHISFGLVEIPVSLVKAEEPHEFDFSLVDRRDHAPIGYERINKSTGKPVAWDDIVRAHESGGELVLVSDEELAHANVEATRTIDILDFVDGAQIHPSYFERPYYLEPQRKQGAKAYTLLREALERSGKVGIATVVLRTRQHLAALTTRGPALVLVLLRFADELRPVERLDVPEEGDKAGLKPKELEMAEQLVDSMTSEWEPERYTDTFFRDVKKMLERKRRSGETEPLEVVEEERPKRGAVVDLMPLLQQSMARGRDRAGTKRAAQSRRKKSTRTSTRAKTKTGTKKKAASAKRRRRRASA